MEKENTKFLKGALAGLVLGVAAGMLLSSKRGKEFQKNAKKAVQNLYDDASDTIGEVGQKAREGYYAFMDKAGKKYDKAKDVVEEFSDKIKEG